MTGDAGDWITGGASYSYTEPGSTFTLDGDASYVRVNVSGAPWQIWFRAPQGQQLAVGTTYTGAERAAFATGANPGFDVFGSGRGCNTVLASFTVLDLATDAGTGAPTAFAGSFESHCEGGTTASRGFVRVNSAVAYAADASLTLTGPASTPAGGAVSLHGVLHGAGGPLGSTPLTVSRTDGTGTTNLPDVTTAADGSFTVDDTMPATDASWTVHFAGSDTVQALSATHVVTIGKYASAIALSAPAVGTRGVAYRVTGVLTSGGSPVAGAAVKYTRRDLAGTRTFTLVSNASGVVSYRDIPAVGGPVTWTLAFAGDDTHAAISTSKVVTVARAATAVSIRTSASIYTYGAKAVVTVHLGTTYNRRDVYIYARPLASPAPTAPGKLIAHVRVNSLGNAVVSYTMRARTTFTVRFSGDYRYNAAARAVSPYVRSKVAISLGGWYARSGSIYLYHGADPAQMITVAPNRSGQCFTAYVQALQGGAWMNVAQLSCGTLDSTSHGYALFTSNRPPGILVRIRASVGNDSVTQTLGATSAWVYLKFT